MSLLGAFVALYWAQFEGKGSRLHLQFVGVTIWARDVYSNKSEWVPVLSRIISESIIL